MLPRFCRAGICIPNGLGRSASRVKARWMTRELARVREVTPWKLDTVKVRRSIRADRTMAARTTSTEAHVDRWALSSHQRRPR